MLVFSFCVYVVLADEFNWFGMFPCPLLHLMSYSCEAESSASITNLFSRHFFSCSFAKFVFYSNISFHATILNSLFILLSVDRDMNRIQINVHI